MLSQVQPRGGKVEGGGRQGGTRQLRVVLKQELWGRGAGPRFPLEGVPGVAGTVLFMGAFTEQQINSRFG